MPWIPDFDDPRYLNEVGWFLYREKYGYNHWTGSYAEERGVWSGMVLDEFLKLSGRERVWITDKRVASIGCGCSGDLSTWPVKKKIAIDPLLYVYQNLGMLIEDAPGTSETVYLSVGAENIPLLDGCVDIVLCRNALDHMPDPRRGLEEISRILTKDGILFLSVDIGGGPTPDEPSPFTAETLAELLKASFEVTSETKGLTPHDEWREYSVRIIARKLSGRTVLLRKENLLHDYERSIARAAE